MSDVQFTNVDLRECLMALPPVDLLALRLLSEQPQILVSTNGVARDQLIQAITEMVQYTQTSTAMAEQIGTLPPIPLLDTPILEFGL